MGGSGSGTPYKFDLTNPKDRKYFLNDYAQAMRELEKTGIRDAKNLHTAIKRKLVEKHGISIATINRYFNNNPDFYEQCTRLADTQKFNFKAKVENGCFNAKGEIIAQNVVIKLLEMYGITQKDGVMQINNNIINATDSNSIKELTEKLTELSDDDLLKIISKQPQQLPEAIDAEVITNADL